jgi:hypothetical protein
MAPERTIREVTAVFTDGEPLETAVSELQSSGIDRANISFMSDLPAATAGKDGPGDVAKDNPTDRRASVSDTDVRVMRNLGVSMAATVAGLAAAGIVVASGGAVLLAAGVAAAAVGGTVAVGEVAGQAAPLAIPTFHDAELLRSGILLIVHVADGAQEARVLDILRRHSERDVTAQDVPATG